MWGSIAADDGLSVSRFVSRSLFSLLSLFQISPIATTISQRWATFSLYSLSLHRKSRTRGMKERAMKRKGRKERKRKWPGQETDRKQNRAKANAKERERI